MSLSIDPDLQYIHNPADKIESATTLIAWAREHSWHGGRRDLSPIIMDGHGEFRFLGLDFDIDRSRAVRIGMATRIRQGPTRCQFDLRCLGTRSPASSAILYTSRLATRSDSG